MTEIKAPMKGKVLKLTVRVGDRVSEDEEVVVLDSMKMEIPVYSHAGGIVRELRVEEGDLVEEREILAILD